MSRFQTMNFFEPSSSIVYREASIYRPKPLFLFPFASPFLMEEDELGSGITDLTLDFFAHKASALDLMFPPPSPCQVFETAIDLIQVVKSPFSTSLTRLQRRLDAESLGSLSDRVSALELGFDGVMGGRKTEGEDRKYKWAAEIKGPGTDGVERKYKWIAEIRESRDEGGRLTGGVEKNYKWTTEMKGKGLRAPISQTYTFKSTTAPSGKAYGSGKPKKEKKKAPRVVEIKEPSDPATFALKQIRERRKSQHIKKEKGKQKELSPQDAAIVIQVSYRAHLVRRSQALRGLRDLAVAKAKLKEIKARFNNFSYRHRIACDAEERQRFSERIIVLLLTVDAIEGVDYMVRSAKRSMVEELEAMLNVVDPQPPGRLGSLKRRKFDLPEAGPIQKEIALGVAGVVQMIDESDNGSTGFQDAPQ